MQMNLKKITLSERSQIQKGLVVYVFISMKCPKEANP